MVLVTFYTGQLFLFFCTMHDAILRFRVPPMSGGTMIVFSEGKGGVGKSTVTANVARCLASVHNKEVGVLDVDLCGPSQPTILGCEGESVHQSGSGWSPVFVDDNLSLMSAGFLLPSQGKHFPEEK